MLNSYAPSLAASWGVFLPLQYLLALLAVAAVLQGNIADYRAKIHVASCQLIRAALSLAQLFTGSLKQYTYRCCCL